MDKLIESNLTSQYSMAVLKDIPGFHLPSSGSIMRPARWHRFIMIRMLKISEIKLKFVVELYLLRLSVILYLGKIFIFE